MNYRDDMQNQNVLQHQNHLDDVVLSRQDHVQVAGNGLHERVSLPHARDSSCRRFRLSFSGGAAGRVGVSGGPSACACT